MSNEIKVADVDQVKELFTVLKDKMNSLKIIEIPELKPLNECTIHEVVAFVNGYYNGYYSLEKIQDVWSVGDVLSIPISNVSKIDNTGISLTGTYDFAIADFNKDTLVSPIKGKTKSLLTFVNSYESSLWFVNNYGKYYPDEEDTSCAYKNTKLRKWCNNNLYNGIDTNIREIIKPVKKRSLRSYPGAKYDVEESEETCWVVSLTEYNGSGSEGSIYSYYSSHGASSSSEVGLGLRTVRDTNTFVDITSKTKTQGGYWYWEGNDNLYTIVGFCL